MAVSRSQLDDLAERRRPITPRAVVVAGYIVAYVALDWLSFIYPIAPLGITPWNPPPGLSLALLFRHGLHLAPWLFVAALSAEILVRGAPAPVPLLALSSLVLAGGYTLAAWLLRAKLKFNPDFGSVRDATVFAAAAVVATGLVAFAYVGTFTLVGILPTDLLARSASQFWIGDLIGIIVTTPLLLISTRKHPPWRELGDPLTLLQCITIGVVLWIVFGSGLSKELNLFYLLFLPLIWIAMRHGLPGTALATLLIQLGLIVALQLGGYQRATVLEFQLLLLALAVTGLFLGTAISERRAIERQLREKQFELDRSLRLAAASEMASALAHELNQPLSAIATYARAGQLMASDPTRSHAALGQTIDKVAHEAARAGAVVDRLRDFFRTGSARLEALDVEPLLRGVVDAERQRAERHRIRFVLDCAQALPRVTADHVQIETVLHNLISNAIDALKQTTRDERVIRVGAIREDAQFIAISVTDNGPGIPEDMADQLFRPFATSKPRGMGLGLAISRSIVEAHAGRLAFQAVDGGCVFRFTLPVRS
ncbi:MAG TPA: MASE1 domain-containing protein [Casimicrobiaceae bacterium]